MMLACPLMRSARLFNGLREQRVLVPYLSSRKSFEDAQELITRFGDNAGFQAAALADRRRDVGNHIHFCHWRQIERLIIWLSIAEVVGTRSEERRVGNECVRSCRYRWATDP